MHLWNVLQWVFGEVACVPDSVPFYSHWQGRWKCLSPGSTCLWMASSCPVHLHTWWYVQYFILTIDYAAWDLTMFVPQWRTNFHIIVIYNSLWINLIPLSLRALQPPEVFHGGRMHPCPSIFCCPSWQYILVHRWHYCTHICSCHTLVMLLDMKHPDVGVLFLPSQNSCHSYLQWKLNLKLRTSWVHSLWNLHPLLAVPSWF